MSACGCGAPYQGRWLLKALLFLAAVLPTSGDCPKSCVCNVPTEVHCTFRYLTAVPDHIQPAVERINLGYNSISVLRENDLSGLENLELLMLHSNTIHSIYNRAFQDLKSLQVLKMSFNKVKEIKKETFKGLDNLLRIHMDHNNIEFISPEAFYGLNKLQLVHLEGNHLQQLHPDTFITLRHSQVFKVSSVRTIHLSENLLTTLPEEIFLGCSQLENLFLHGNPWTCDCRMKWFSVWAQRNTGVLKCKRDRRYPRGQLCPVCENPAPYHNTPLFLLSGDAFTCTKPWIQPHLKQKNISLDEGDFTPVSPKDFIAPLGSIQMNLTDHFHNDASLSCTVQRPSTFENLTQTLEEEEGNNATVLTAGIITYLVCNIDYEHIQQLWHILATYSDSPMTLERGFMLARRPEMVYRYSQIKTKEGEEGIYTNIVAEIKASPEWLMQGEVSFQLDRTTTTFSTLHIKYQSVINLRVENTSPKRGHYSWTMIKRDNQTKTEHTVLTGGVVQLDCQIWGSTIISRQQIHIIPRKNSRGGGRRRTFQGRRRIIKPNRITDIQSFINKLQKPSLMKEGNATVPYRIELTTDCDWDEDKKKTAKKTATTDLQPVTPTPAITWKRFHSNTGTTVTVKGRMGKFEVLSNGTLSIQNANIKDRGQYLCLAENDYGSDKLLVTLSVVTYPSRILEPTMRDIKSHAGNNVEMTCKAEGRPIPMISWILANQTQVRGQNTEKGRVSVSTDGTLVIEQVSVYDRGHYKCIASNPAGADTATVRLQVVAAPPGIVEEKRQQVKVGVSQNLWLPCTGQGSPQPTIHWVLHDGSTVRYNRPASDTRVSVYRNGTLHIKDVTQEDSGKYECIATSSTGSERMVVTLTVERQESAPQIMETSKRVTALFFEDQLRLSCSATGDPKPRIIWRLPSKAVVDQWHRMGSRIQVLDNGTLIIGLVSDKDAGDYLCVARNKIGDDLQLMKVSVSMKPAKIEPKLYGKKQVPYGKDFKVDCKASGAPKPEISWGLPDGTVVNSALQSDASSGGGRPRRYTLFDNGTLHLNQVGMSEEGDYTCYAENQVGKDEMHFHITVVTAAARIRPTSQTYVRVKPGGKIRFDCEALGEPKPKILWMLPTNDVIAASNERYLMHVNGSLDIRDVKLIDAGEYVCMARNPAGENRKVYKLDIEGNPPVINGYWQNRTVIKDVAAKYSRKFIDCKAEGDPMPSITWIMPDNIFLKAPYYGSRINVHHNGTLEIRNVRPTDTAEFICMARNDGGEAVMVVQLEVSSILRRPIFKNPFNERIVSRIGKTTVLNCSADGYPVPEITWTLPNGTRITSGHHLVRNGTLVIYDSGNEDAGKYRCGAKNFIGYIEKLIILDVGQKPYILTRPRGIIRSVSGEPLFLHCLSDGSPRPKIHWTIPSGHTLTRPQVLGRYQLLENGTLVVQDTTLHDRGNYICRARSDAGEAVLTVPVVIIAYPPRITLGPPPSVRSLTGTPIQLNCAAIGIPKPEITWELPNRSVLSAAEQGRPMGSELLHPQGTLIIQRPKASDSGTYKCLAKNLLGTDSKITYVHIF
ncbi:hypothetical protein VZT92_020819 [Zoarces viviparus]|uniref:Ig-like domain-containing protein n=1 Tax=Zoarces viviparus TaxID=48416 RepID=A0AAW1EGK0_ZOAVI